MPPNRLAVGPLERVNAVSPRDEDGVSRDQGRELPPSKAGSRATTAIRRFPARCISNPRESRCRRGRRRWPARRSCFAACKCVTIFPCRRQRSRAAEPAPIVAEIGGPLVDYRRAGHELIGLCLRRVFPKKCRAPSAGTRPPPIAGSLHIKLRCQPIEAVSPDCAVLAVGVCAGGTFAARRQTGS